MERDEYYFPRTYLIELYKKKGIVEREDMICHLSMLLNTYYEDARDLIDGYIDFEDVRTRRDDDSLIMLR